MNPWIERYQYVGDVRGIGLSIGIDIVSNKIEKTRDSEAALKICNYCFENGVIIIAVAGNVLRFQPPLVITYKQLDKALDAKNKGDYYEIHAHNKSHAGGSIITVYKDGT
ncbi:aminotransferase class III-fold pyridoxal phosphate-dependent enzyme, partial [Micromonospora chersina]